MLRSSLVLLVVVLALVARPVQGQNFRMETDVFVGTQKKPLCQTLTLFTETMVYDFIYGPTDDKKQDEQQITEVTIFDMSAGRVILLNVPKQKKTVLTHEELVRLTTAMKLHTNERDAVYYFAAHPLFDSSFNDASLELKLSSTSLTYVIKGLRPQQAAAVWRYQEFADWSARLNACRPGNLPPFARMEVGKQLADLGLIPEEITRTTVAPGRLGSKKVEMRSRHMVNWLLSDKDRRRVETVAEQIARFETIGFMAFVDADKK